MRNGRPGQAGPDIVFVQADNAVDHLPGVRDELAARGLTSARQDEPYCAPSIRAGTRVVVVTSTAPRCMMALRQAERVNARTVLLLDGITDWRNTLLNPRQTECYLRPAGVDLVLCSGLSDARVLRGLGNRAAATGLPRIDSVFGDVATSRERRTGPVLVATANTPAFSDAERERLLDALRELQEEAGYAGVPLHWRLTGGLDDELGVTSERGPLAELLSASRATICTPSTLMVESMRAGVPTALLHAESTPLWHAAPWVWQPTELAAAPDSTHVPQPLSGLTRWVDSASRLLRQLSMPTREQLDRQRECLTWLDASSGGARSAELVAEELAALARSTPVRLDITPRVPTDAKQLVSIVSVEGEWFETVLEHERRINAALELEGWRTSTVAIAWDDESERRARRLGCATVCRMDPAAAWEINTERLRDAIGSVPTAVLVHVGDTPRLIAQQPLISAPLVAVAHTADEAFAGWRSAWSWSAAIAVEPDAEPWITRHAGGRPVAVVPNDEADLRRVLSPVVESARRSEAPLHRQTPSLERLPARKPKQGALRRVVSLVSFEESALGGVTTFSQRLAEGFAARPDLGFDAHTLFVAWDASSASRAHAMLGEHASLCVLDRSRPMHVILDHLRE
ncbi:MAG: hypothetical protein AAFY46_02220, partial [Planctomycetota bacterium]